jgi:hypothetical protein
MHAPPLAGNLAYPTTMQRRASTTAKDEALGRPHRKNAQLCLQQKHIPPKGASKRVLPAPSSYLVHSDTWRNDRCAGIMHLPAIHMPQMWRPILELMHHCAVSSSHHNLLQ